MAADAIHGPQGLISSRLSRVLVNPGPLGEHWLSLLKAVKLKALNVRLKTLNVRRLSILERGGRPRQNLRRAAPNSGHRTNFPKNFINNVPAAKHCRRDQ